MAEGIVVSIHLASGATEPMRGVADARAVLGSGLRVCGMTPSTHPGE